MAADLAELEAALGHHFAVPELLVRALTHRSLANEQALHDAQPDHVGGVTQIVKTTVGKITLKQAGDNERLEFLGDAVLGLLVAEALFQRILTGMRASSPASAPS